MGENEVLWHFTYPDNYKNCWDMLPDIFLLYAVCAGSPSIKISEQTK